MPSHVTEQNATHVSHIPHQYQGCFAVFSRRAIMDEYQLLHDLLKSEYPSLKSSKNMEDNEWETLIKNLCSRFSLLFETDTYVDFLRGGMSDQDLRALLRQLQRVLAALRYTEGVLDHMSSPTGLLLPASFSNRMNMLLGHAALPVVWVRMLDVMAFETDIR
ncbi:hypothetical protein V8687_03835 [Shewanella baltica]|uniref:hypothetical protein n=1 Tax=Shewanella baltica TaxID=62322 RepID=UPI0030CF6B0F